MVKMTGPRREVEKVNVIGVVVSCGSCFSGDAYAMPHGMPLAGTGRDRAR